MSAPAEGFTDQLEGLASRVLNSIYEEDLNCWAVLSRYYSFRDHRKVLFVINLILTISGIMLVGSAAVPAYIFYDEYYYTLYLAFAGAGAAFVLFVTISIIGMRGAALVSLDHLLTYFWGAVMFTGPLLLCVIFCLDFYDFMYVYYKHQWELPNFENMRTIFCDPDNTGKCGAPLHGYDDWCRTNYNATDCLSYREDGIEHAVTYSRNYTLAQAIVCGTQLVFIGFALFLCHRIITDAVLTQSMNEVINYLLILPIGASGSLAYYLWWLTDYDSDELQYSWLPSTFIGGAAGILVALPIGITGGKLKWTSFLNVYIFIMLGVLAVMIINGVYSIIFAGILNEVFTPTTSELGEIACDRGLVGCCCCGSGYDDVENRCPEWEDYEILSILVLDLKISGISSFACILYVIGALIIAILMRNSLVNYRSDYVGMGKTVEDDDRDVDPERKALEASKGRMGVGAAFMPSFPSSSSSSSSAEAAGGSVIEGFKASTVATNSSRSRGDEERGFSPVAFDAPSSGSSAGQSSSGVSFSSLFNLKGVSGSGAGRAASTAGSEAPSRRTGSIDSLYSAETGPILSSSPDDTSSGAMELKQVRSLSIDELSDSMSAVTAISGRSASHRIARGPSLKYTMGVNPDYHAEGGDDDNEEDKNE